MHEIYFHEDDVGQLEILPISKWHYCEHELAAVAEHDAAHRAPGGVGWTKMYMPGAAEEPLQGLEMTATRFAELLAPHCKQFDRLESPLSDVDVELGIRRIGFGPSDAGGVVADLQGELVSSIWCLLPGATRDENELLAAMLISLTRDQHLLLMDWLRARAVDLRSKPGVETYLAS